MRNPAIQSGKHRGRYLAIFGVVALLLIELTTGSVRYAAMTAWCLHLPITGSRFAASYHYFKPGRAYYGPSAFAEYYCTEDQAKNAGLNPGF